MHNNYYFLRQLSKSLNEQLQGLNLLECFSQNKDELILGFANNERSFYVKAHLQSNFCCLCFPNQFLRSKKNSVNLFDEVMNIVVLAVRQYENERCFAIEFEGNQQLLFKMHGNRSNIIYIHNNHIRNIFKNNLSKDLDIDINQLDRKIDQSQQAFEQSNGDLKKLYPTFGSLFLNYVNNRLITAGNKWSELQEIIESLENPFFHIVNNSGIPVFSLAPIGEVLSTYNNPIEAINEFFNYYQKITQLKSEKDSVITSLTKKIIQSGNFIRKTESKLQQIQNDLGYETIANIIMANLHNIQSHSSHINLLNFYTEQPIDIKLNPKLTPQKNAENYYRKGKNQKLEIDKLESTLKNKKNELAQLELHLETVESLNTVKEIRDYISNNSLESKKSIKQESRAYYQFHYGGYEIWVGKNAKNNDILTKKLAWKDDLWLHAKDVSGSHVIIKHQSGKKFPKEVIHAAAQLAAYYSKRKTDSLCPVIVTPKKFVRKPKGSAPGAVVVDKEDVLLVVPNKI